MILVALVLFEVILLEFILGLSNIWFTSFLGERLPSYYKEKARKLGLFFAWGIRVLVLIFYSFVVDSHFSLKAFPGINFYWIDIILLVGGAWILFKTVNVLFFRKTSTMASSSDFNIVLLQGMFISTVLSVDAVRTASFYVNNTWVAALVVLGSMLASSWLSRKVIDRLHIQTKGLVLLLFSTGLLLLLEAFHQPLLSELICFGAALYIMNVYFIPKYSKLNEKAKIVN